MAGRHQLAPILRHPPFGWQMQFAQLGGRKWTCVVCGSRGYSGGRTRWDGVLVPSPWQASCLLGHPEVCPECGGRFVKGGLRQHLRCRSGHRHCPEHVDTQHRRLLRGLSEMVGGVG